VQAFIVGHQIQLGSTQFLSLRASLMTHDGAARSCVSNQLTEVLLLGCFLSKQRQQHFVPILVAFVITLALGDQLFVMRRLRYGRNLPLRPPKGLRREVQAALNIQWRLSNIAHPAPFIFFRLAQGFSGRSVDEIQSHRDDVGKQSTPQRLPGVFSCRSSSRDHESEIIAKLCDIAQLRGHFRSIG
jgi:hypothetical protein